jgi:hypothetical protein
MSKNQILPKLNTYSFLVPPYQIPLFTDPKAYTLTYFSRLPILKPLLPLTLKVLLF